jgi:uncharacterized membrane protein
MVNRTPAASNGGGGGRRPHASPPAVETMDMGRPAGFSSQIRGRLPAILLALDLLGLLLTLLAIVVSRTQGRDLIEVLIRLAVFLAVVAAVTGLARVRPDFRAALSSRLEAACAACDARLAGRRAGLAVAAMMVLYAAFWSVLSILRHEALNSAGYDLGIQHQVIWSLAHGRGFAASIEVHNYLGDHVCLTMPLFAPLLWIWNDVRILLIAQSVVLALGAWPVYRLARRRGGAIEGVVWSAVYLLLPAIGFINKYDFHEVVLALPLLLAAIDAVDQRRLGRATFWLVLSAATREEIGIAVAAIGLWAFIRRRRRLWGGAIAAGALAWAVFALYWVIPHMREGAASDTLDRYVWLGGRPGTIARTLLTRPWILFAGHYHRVRRLLYPWQLVWPMAGLPLLAPGLALLALPSFGISYTSSDVCQNSIYFQYNLPILALLFWAAVEGSRRLRSAGVARGWILGGLILSLLGANWADPAAFKSLLAPYTIVDGITPRPNRAAFAEASRLIPPQADLLAGNYLAPHFSARPHLLVYTPSAGIPDASWVILDVTDHRDFETDREPLAGASALVLQRGYRVRFFRDGIIVLARGGESDSSATRAFRAWAAARGPEPSSGSRPGGR